MGIGLGRVCLDRHQCANSYITYLGDVGIKILGKKLGCMLRGTFYPDEITPYTVPVPI